MPRWRRCSGVSHRRVNGGAGDYLLAELHPHDRLHGAAPRPDGDERQLDRAA